MPRPAIGFAAFSAGSRRLGLGEADEARQLRHRQVQHDRLDPVVAELLDACLVGEAVDSAAQVIDGGDVERAVADRDLVEAVGREVLPDAVGCAVGRQVQARSRQADLGARRLRHERMRHVPGAFADDADHEHDADDGGQRRRARARRRRRSDAPRSAPSLPASSCAPAPASSARNERREREHAPGHAHAVPARRVVEQQAIRIAVAGQPEADREHRADDDPHRQTDAQSARVERRRAGRAARAAGSSRPGRAPARSWSARVRARRRSRSPQTRFSEEADSHAAGPAEYVLTSLIVRLAVG